jgi:heme A synthase
MSHDESSAIESMRQTIKWLIGGIVGLLSVAFAVGAWVALQESKIANLQDADRASIADRGDLRGQLRGQSELLNTLRQDTALQNRDLQYIRESVTKIEKIITKP